MRLIQVCLPFVFPWMMGSAMLAGQQAQPVTAQKSTQTSAAKPSTQQASRTTATHPAAHRKHRKAAARKGSKRPEYRPEYSENSVEVINGDATRKVVFHDDQATTTLEKKLPAGVKNAPTPMKVEVVNGSSTETQYFYNNRLDQQSETGRNQPVVIGIQSSDTRLVGGNKHPVVTSVTSSGSGDAKTASGGGQPVIKQLSPRPNRPVYEPEPH